MYLQKATPECALLKQGSEPKKWKTQDPGDREVNTGEKKEFLY